MLSDEYLKDAEYWFKATCHAEADKEWANRHMWLCLLLSNFYKTEREGE